MPPFVADAIFWIAVACSLVAQVAIVRAAFVKYGGTRDPRADGGAAAAAAARPEPTTRRGREVTWAVVPGIALALVLYFTWRAVHPLPPRGTAGSGAAPAATTTNGART